jgi:hypothetical protein
MGLLFGYWSVPFDETAHCFSPFRSVEEADEEIGFFDESFVQG